MRRIIFFFLSNTACVLYVQRNIQDILLYDGNAIYVRVRMCELWVIMTFKRQLPKDWSWTQVVWMRTHDRKRKKT